MPWFQYTGPTGVVTWQGRILASGEVIEASATHEDFDPALFVAINAPPEPAEEE